MRRQTTDELVSIVYSREDVRTDLVVQACPCSTAERRRLNLQNLPRDPQTDLPRIPIRRLVAVTPRKVRSMESQPLLGDGETDHEGA